MRRPGASQKKSGQTPARGAGKFKLLMGIGRGTGNNPLCWCTATMEAIMVHPATKKRGADPAVPEKSKHQKPVRTSERKLEQGLEESMAGSDPINITQPKPSNEPDKKRKED
jgi:hypothetical protein